MKPCTVYLVRCLSNDKVYVGIADKVGSRQRQHLGDARRNPKYPFQKALRKHGISNFEWIVVSTLPSREEACLLERLLISVLLATEPEYGYNLTDGGEGVRGPRVHRKSQKGRVFSDEHRARMSQSRRKRGPFSLESREKMSKTHMGKPANFSPEALAKISAANKGKKRSAATRAKMSVARKGKPRKPLSEETRAKMSVAHKGKTLSDAAKAKLSFFHKGKRLSEETKAKMRGPRGPHKMKMEKNSA